MGRGPHFPFRERLNVASTRPRIPGLPRGNDAQRPAWVYFWRPPVYFVWSARAS